MIHLVILISMQWAGRQKTVDRRNLMLNIFLSELPNDFWKS